MEKDITAFVRKLPTADEAWIFSGSSDGSKGDTTQDWSAVSKKDFVDAVEEYRNSGRGVAIFADAAPLITEANAILERFYNVSGFSRKEFLTIH